MNGRLSVISNVVHAGFPWSCGVWQEESVFGGLATNTVKISLDLPKLLIILYARRGNE